MPRYVSKHDDWRKEKSMEFIRIRVLNIDGRGSEEGGRW